ncbi:hypothetical protein AN218_24745 [Streptomyces nanshensis]|uniref:Uncharacterized protein n=1 Tax=Streptomyces nanshensis TaxID=518642 RepID=A0A1E7KY40_9ACTN|nr:hypothetical protein AN218_24745 [Streptomyces nanshensis]
MPEVLRRLIVRGALRTARRQRIRRDLLVQFAQPRGPHRRRLTLHLTQQMSAPLAEVGDPRGQSLRVERETHRVQRRLQQPGRRPFQQGEDGAVGGGHVVAAVPPSRTGAGYGSYAAAVRSRPERNGPRAGESSGVSGQCGA